MFEIIPNYHPLAVHFPITLLVLAPLLFLLAYLRASSPTGERLAWSAHWALRLGALAALIAVALGLQAYGSVTHDDVGHAAMHIHRAWGLSTFGFASALAGWSFLTTRRHGYRATPPMLGGALATAILVITTGWWGGELTYRHGLGVLRLPVQEERVSVEKAETPAASVHLHTHATPHRH